MFNLIALLVKKMSEKLVELSSENEVKNIRGTHDCSQTQYSSWKEFYTAHASGKWPDECRISGCTNKAAHGAHVHIKGCHGVVFIIPMYAGHNNPKKVLPMIVKANTTAVRVDEEDTHGPQGTCFSNILK